MSPMSKVTIISSALLHHHHHHPTTLLDLTPWDLLHLLHGSIQIGLLFPITTPQPQTLIPHLKASLSRTLGFFPSLSGRLTTITHPDATISIFIDCNDAGAEFIHAAADSVSISDVVNKNYIPDDIVSAFFPLDVGTNYSEGSSGPLLKVQVTVLADGVFIGCTINHLAADGASFWHFFKSWSEISRGLDTISKLPVFDRFRPTTKNLPIHIAPLDENPAIPNSTVATPLLERVFHFRKDSLSKLKEKANVEAGCGKISTLQALSAHLWRSVIRVGRNIHVKYGEAQDEEQQHLFPLLMDARNRIPLPDGYFGNAAYGAFLLVSERDLVEKGLGFTALRFHELVGKQSRESAVKFVDDWIESPIIPRKGRSGFLMTSSPWFDVYGCDFGWGKPIASITGGADRVDGRMVVEPAPPEAGGIYIFATLEQTTMGALENDVEFNQFFTM